MGGTTKGHKKTGSGKYVYWGSCGDGFTGVSICHNLHSDVSNVCSLLYGNDTSIRLFKALTKLGGKQQ